MYSPNTRKRLYLGLALLGTGIAAAFCLLEATSSLDWLENRSADWRTTASVDPKRADRDIVIIDIDNPKFLGDHGSVGPVAVDAEVVDGATGLPDRRGRGQSSSMSSSAVRKRALTRGSQRRSAVQAT